MFTKPLPLAVGMLLLASLSPGPAAAESWRSIFSDSFDHAALSAAWSNEGLGVEQVGRTVCSGCAPSHTVTVRAKTTVVASSRGNVRLLLYPRASMHWTHDGELADVRVSARIGFPSGAPAGANGAYAALRVRMVDDANTYVVKVTKLSATTVGVDVVRRVNGHDTVLASKSAPIGEASFAVEAVGHDLTVLRGGAPLLHVTDTDGFSRGAVGLELFNRSVWADDFAVAVP